MVSAILAATVILISVFTVTATVETTYIRGGIAPSVDYGDAIMPQGDGYDRGAYEYVNANNRSIIINHTCTDLSQIPEEWIIAAKDNLHIAYGHTSHGSQIITGMNGLDTFMGGTGLYVWNDGPSANHLDMDDYAFDEYEAYDLGNPDLTAWLQATRDYLDANSDVNAVIWSWCGQLSWMSTAGVTNYLNNMASLEGEYPDVDFVYMTGHLNIWDWATTKANNQQIRDYCITNNKTLFDFADIESYDPDGVFYDYANDDCSYHDDRYGSNLLGNWAIEWQNNHTEGAGGNWYDCGDPDCCAHSQPLNCNQKAYAAWWMMARIAGWDGAAPPITLTCSDGTPYGQCNSSNKPKYCDNGTLIDNCSHCGCNVEQSCNTTSGACYTPTAIENRTQLIQPSDLEYKGAFRLPEGSKGSNWEYSGAAMTYYPDGDPNGHADGYPGSIFAVGHDWQMHVSEINIPIPVISQTKSLGELNTATTLQEFHDVRAGLFDNLNEIIRVGMEYLPKQGLQTTDKLYFAWGHHLQEEPPELMPSHIWCELNLSNPQTAGPWWIGDSSISIYSVNDYLFEIPGDLAAANTPEKLLATGRFRDGGWSGQGPSLYAIGPWNDGNPPAPDTRLNATTLLHYDSSYIENGHTMNDYHHSDEWSGGAWLTAGNKSAVIFVGTKGTGECWYGDPDGPCLDCDNRGWWSTGFIGEIIFYDPADLAAVVNGTMESYEPQPYATLNIDQYLHNVKSTQQKEHVRAVCFNRARSLLYIIEPFADNGKSLVHVWSINDSSINIYHVAPYGNDSNPGTIDQPWRTIQHAADTLHAGDTVMIRAGTYNEHVVIQNSGTTGNFITYSAYPGEGVLLNGTGVQPSWMSGISIGDGASYIRVKDLVISNFNTNGMVIEQNNSHIEIIGVEVEKSGDTGIKITPVSNWHADHILIQDCNIHHNNLIGIDCPGYVKHVRIINATTSYNGYGTGNTAADGIAFEPRSDDIIIERCTSSFNGGDGLDSKAGNTTISRSISHHNNRDGIKLWGNNTTLVNSISHHNGLAGLVLEGGNSYTVTNNLIADRMTYGYLAELGSYGASIPTDISLHNNIFFNSIPDMGGTLVYIADGVNLTADNNLYWNPYRTDAVICAVFLPHGCYSSSDITTGKWHNDSGSGKHSMYADPLFIDPVKGDYHPQAESPAIDNGTSKQAPTVDLDGNPRPKGAGYDIGPYEFIPTPVSAQGDLNRDGEITPADAAIALQAAASGDGSITSLDALMIQQAATGAISL